MTTSGTTTFSLAVDDLLNEAMERAGIYQSPTGEMLRSARRSLDLMLQDWTNRGYNLWQIAETSFTTTQGQSDYTVTGGALPDDLVDVLDLTVTDGQGGEVIANRISQHEYSNRINRDSEGRPTEFWYDRQRDNKRLVLWLTPDGAYTVKFWYLRAIEDVGAPGNNLDIPAPFLDAAAAGLAWRMALKQPDAQSGRLQMLKGDYDATLQRAMRENRETAPVRIGIRGYRGY